MRQETIAALCVQHLTELGMSKALAIELVDVAWPSIEPLEESETTFRITTSPIVSTIGCIMSGDLNAAVHTTSDGFTQTLAIIGMCAAVASRTTPGYRLAKILPDISFKRPIPLGHPVIMRTEVLQQRAAVVRVGLEGWLDTEERPTIFSPRELIMVRVDSDKH